MGSHTGEPAARLPYASELTTISVADMLDVVKEADEKMYENKYFIKSREQE